MRKNNNLTAFFLMAKYDDEFLKEVLDNKEHAIEEKGFEFTKSEKLIIDKLEGNKLKNFIKTYKISGIQRSSLPNWKSVAAILILISTIAVSSSGCRAKKRATMGCFADTDKDNLLVQVDEKKENTQTNE